MEAIFLIIDDATDKRAPSRKPHADIIGKIKIHGDIINTIPEQLWIL
jgi:hypothetical protein